MRVVSISDARTHLSRLMEEAAKGDAFIIAKAGKPMVIVEPLSSEAVARLQEIHERGQD